VLSCLLAASRGIRWCCGASCPYRSLDRGACGLVVGDDSVCVLTLALILLGRLPPPAPPSLTACGSLDCRCLGLQQSLALYDYYHEQIRDCDRVLEDHLKAMALPEVPPLEPKRRVRRRKDNEVTFDARQRLHQVTGVDLTAIEGIEESTALVVLSEIGTDMSRWPSEKHFGSWLGLTPNPKKSGGQVQSSATRPGVNRAAQ
jgi:Transposase IS116/IS110/IS902 family